MIILWTLPLFELLPSKDMECRKILLGVMLLICFEVTRWNYTFGQTTSQEMHEPVPLDIPNTNSSRHLSFAPASSSTSSTDGPTNVSSSEKTAKEDSPSSRVTRSANGVDDTPVDRSTSQKRSMGEAASNAFLNTEGSKELGEETAVRFWNLKRRQRRSAGPFCPLEKGPVNATSNFAMIHIRPKSLPFYINTITYVRSYNKHTYEYQVEHLCFSFSSENIDVWWRVGHWTTVDLTWEGDSEEGWRSCLMNLCGTEPLYGEQLLPPNIYIPSYLADWYVGDLNRDCLEKGNHVTGHHRSSSDSFKEGKLEKYFVIETIKK